MFPNYHFEGISLHHVVENRKFEHCAFVDCKLESATFRNCTFSNTYFYECYLDKTDLTGSSFDRCVIDHCNISGMRIHLKQETDVLFTRCRFGEDSDVKCQYERFYQDWPNFFLLEIREGGQATAYVVTPRVSTSYYQIGQKYLVRRIECKSKREMRRLEAECSNLKDLKSPYVPRLIDTKGVESKYYYLVMEYADGCPLSRFLKHKHALGDETKKEVFLQAFMALRDIHCREVVHRDLSPSNVIIKLLDGRPPRVSLKLIDFGFSKNLRSFPPDNPTRVFSPPGYQPPELYGNPPQYDTQGDQFGLAATLYHMWTGRHPFGLGPDATVEEYRPLAAKGRISFDDIVKPYNYILKKCLKPSVKHRFGDTREIGDLLLGR